MVVRLESKAQALAQLRETVLCLIGQLASLGCDIFGTAYLDEDEDEKQQ